MEWFQKSEEQSVQEFDYLLVNTKTTQSRLRTPDGGNYIGWLSSSELGKAFGRENITHCALASGGLTQRIVEDAQRLKGLRIVKDQNSCRKDESAK